MSAYLWSRECVGRKDYNMNIVRIGIVGDSGVGKSTLAAKVRFILDPSCECEERSSPQPINPTIGCDIDIFECYNTTYCTTFHLEVFDIGGNPRFDKNVFFEGCHGFIYMWDCAHEVTFHSLENWLREISAALQLDEGIYHDDEHHPNERSSSKSGIPILIIGNKLDTISPSKQEELRQACPQQLFLSCRSEDWNYQPLLDFFCEVYDVVYGRLHNTNSIAIPESISNFDDKICESVERAEEPAVFPGVLPYPPFLFSKRNFSRSNDESLSDDLKSPSKSAETTSKSSTGLEISLQSQSSTVIEMPSAANSKSEFTLLRHRVSKW